MCKNTRNMLSNIVDIIIKVRIHRRYEKNTPFMRRQRKKINKKNKFLNEEHNEKIKCNNSRKRMQ